MRIGSGAGRDGGVELAPRGRAPRASPRGEASEVREPRGTGPPAEGPSPFGRLLRALGREVDRGEATVKRVLSPSATDLGPGELLALQAGIYRYSEAVDLSAKLVDRATSGLKTVLQGQS